METTAAWDNEREIDLKGLMVYVLRKWRGAILFGVILCVLAGGIGVLLSLRNMNNQSAVAKVNENARHEEEQYKTSKKMLENQMAKLTQTINDENSYQEKSILMNLNPYDLYKESGAYYISTGYMVDPNLKVTPTDPTKSVIGAYVALITGEGFIQDIKEELGSDLDSRYIRELINIDVDYDANLLYFTIVGESETQVKQIGDALKQEISRRENKVTTAVYSHDIELISDRLSRTSDSTLSVMDSEKSVAALQNDHYTRVQNYQSQMEQYQKQYDELKEPSTAAVSKITIIKQNAKKGILGFAGGIFLYFFAAAAWYILCGRMMEAEELSSYYGIHIFAVRRKRQGKGFLDEILNRIDGVKESNTELSSIFELAASYIKLEKNEGNAVLIGTLPDQKYDEVLKGLNAALEKERCALLLRGGDINRSSAAIDALGNASSVVIIEERGQSLQKEIDAELQAIKKAGKKILGAIVI